MRSIIINNDIEKTEETVSDSFFAKYLAIDCRIHDIDVHSNPETDTLYFFEVSEYGYHTLIGKIELEG